MFNIIFYILLLIVFSSASRKKPDYVIRHDRAELVSYNEEFLENVFFNFTKPNRNSTYFNLGVTLKTEIVKNLIAVVKIYKNNNNELKNLGWAIPIPLCESMQNNLFGVKAFLKNSNVKQCPLKKGFYYIRNGVPDEKQFPPHLPPGDFMAEGMFYLDKKLLGVGRWYGAVQEIIHWQ